MARTDFNVTFTPAMGDAMAQYLPVGGVPLELCEEDNENKMESLEEVFCKFPERGCVVLDAVQRLLRSVTLSANADDDALSKKDKEHVIHGLAAQCGDYWARVLDEAYTKKWTSVKHNERLRLLAMYVAVMVVEVFERVPAQLAALVKSGVFTGHGNVVYVNAEAGEALLKRCRSIKLSEWMKRPKFTLQDCYNWQKQQTSRRQQLVQQQQQRSREQQQVQHNREHRRPSHGSGGTTLKAMATTVPSTGERTLHSLPGSQAESHTRQDSVQPESETDHPFLSKPGTACLTTATEPRRLLERCPSLPAIKTRQTQGLDPNDPLLTRRAHWRTEYLDLIYDEEEVEIVHAQSSTCLGLSGGHVDKLSRLRSLYTGGECTQATSTKSERDDSLQDIFRAASGAESPEAPRTLSPDTDPLLHAVVRERRVRPMAGPNPLASPDPSPRTALRQQQPTSNPPSTRLTTARAPHSVAFDFNQESSTQAQSTTSVSSVTSTSTTGSRRPRESPDGASGVDADASDLSLTPSSLQLQHLDISRYPQQVSGASYAAGGSASSMMAGGGGGGQQQQQHVQHDWHLNSQQAADSTVALGGYGAPYAHGSDISLPSTVNPRHYGSQGSDLPMYQISQISLGSCPDEFGSSVANDETYVAAYQPETQFISEGGEAENISVASQADFPTASPVPGSVHAAHDGDTPRSQRARRESAAGLDVSATSAGGYPRWQVDEEEDPQREALHAHACTHREPPLSDVDTVQLKLAEYHGLKPVTLAWVRVSDRDLCCDMLDVTQPPLYNPLIHKISGEIGRQLDKNTDEERKLEEVFAELENVIPDQHNPYDADIPVHPAPAHLSEPLGDMMSSAFIQDENSPLRACEHLRRTNQPPWHGHEFDEWLRNFGRHGGFHCGMSKPSEDGQSSAGTLGSMDAKTERSFRSWRQWWMTTINTEDYYRYLTQSESDFLHCAFHLYEPAPEPDTTPPPTPHPEDMRNKPWFQPADDYTTGTWSMSEDVLTALAATDNLIPVDDVSTPVAEENAETDEEREERERREARELKKRKEQDPAFFIQQDLQAVWRQFYLADSDLIELSVKYGGAHLPPSVLTKALELWRRILSLINDREVVIASWEIHPSFLPGGTAEVTPEEIGVEITAARKLTASWPRTAHRFDTGLTKQQARLNKIEKQLRAAIGKMRTDFGDEVLFMGRNYLEKMKSDLRERVFWQHHHHRKVAIEKSRMPVSVATVDL